MKKCVTLLFTFAFLTVAPGLLAQGTTFTYQGQLMEAGAPADGFYDFKFALSNAPSGGSQVGSTDTQTDVGVTNGVFTTTLDFGAVFTGNATWLAISVRSNGVGSYTPLAPPQELTPAPYAIFANMASNVSGALSLAQLPSAVVTNDETNVSLVNVTVSGNFSLPLPATVYAGANTILVAPENNNFYAGPNAGVSNGSGGGNTGVGGESLQSNTNGTNNTGFGYDTLGNNTNGSDNTAVGTRALYSNTSGNDNTGTGRRALEDNTSGTDNTAMGHEALASLGGGSFNIALGSQAGGNYSANESSNILIGSPGVGGDYNTIRLGGGQTNTFIAGVINGNGSGLTNVTISGLQYSGTGNGDFTVTPSGGSVANYIDPGCVDSAICGGAGNTISNAGNAIIIGGGVQNSVWGTNLECVISGGDRNIIYSDINYGAICGGQSNAIFGNFSFVGSGQENHAAAEWSVASGGQYNEAAGNLLTVGGGFNNQTFGVCSTIPGGSNNQASGNSSFAAGQYAYANNNNSFVWSDGSDIDESTSTNNNSVTFLASGGYRFFTGFQAGTSLGPNATSWTTISDRNEKKNFAPVDTVGVLNKLAAIPIQQWNYKWEKDDDVPNIGPMAQDFKAAFYPGRDDKGITTLEFDGVELAAIQGLNQKLDEKVATIQEQAAEIEKLKEKADKVDSLEKQLNELKQLVQSLADKKSDDQERRQSNQSGGSRQ